MPTRSPVRDLTRPVHVDNKLFQRAISRNITLTATLAQRIGDNPYPDIASGNDQDGTKKISRLWLSVNMPF